MDSPFVVFGFNLMRGGTTMIQGVLVLIGACIAAFGPQRVLDAIRVGWQHFVGNNRALRSYA